MGGYFHEWWKEEAVKELAANTTASMRAVLPHKTNRRLRLFHFFPLFFRSSSSPSSSDSIAAASGHHQSEITLRLDVRHCPPGIHCSTCQASG